MVKDEFAWIIVHKGTCENEAKRLLCGYQKPASVDTKTDEDKHAEGKQITLDKVVDTCSESSGKQLSIAERIANTKPLPFFSFRNEQLRESAQIQLLRKMLDELSLLTRSKYTRETYLNGLLYFMRHCHIENLDGLIEEIKAGRVSADEVYKQYVVKLSASGLAPKSVATWSLGLRKLFEANDIQLSKRVRIKTYVIHEDVLPTKEELRKVVNSVDLRARTAILILASSGLRLDELHQLRLKILISTNLLLL